MDLHEEERLTIEKATVAAELRMAMEEGVEGVWFYAMDDANGQRLYGLTDEGKRVMQPGELGVRPQLAIVAFK